MNRLDNMLERLPPPWRIEAGSLLWRLLQIVGNQLDAFDEDLVTLGGRFRRSRWLVWSTKREGPGNESAPSAAVRG